MKLLINLIQKSNRHYQLKLESFLLIEKVTSLIFASKQNYFICEGKKFLKLKTKLIQHNIIMRFLISSSLFELSKQPKKEGGYLFCVVDKKKLIRKIK